MKIKNKILAIVILILFLSSGLVLYDSARRIPYKITLNYNEGWNVFHTLDVVQKRNIYANKLTPVNYPPIYFYLNSVFAKFYDPLITGRTIEIISLLFIILLLIRILILIGLDSYKSVFCGLICLAFMEIVAPMYIGMNDPQFLGEAFMLFGLYLYLKKTKNREIFAALFLLLGIFTKSNLVAMPLALTLYIFLNESKNFTKWIVSLLALGLGFVLLFQLQSKGLFIESVFLPRWYSLYHAKDLSKFFFSIFTFPFILALPLFFKPNIKTSFALYYFFISLLTGVFFSGGAGINVNVFFDVIISFSLLLGTLISEQSKSQIANNSATLLVCFLGLFFAFMAFENYRYLDYELQQKTVLSDVALIQSYKGAAFCAEPILCYFAKKKFELDPFMTGEMILTNKISEEEVLSGINSGKFSIIQWRHASDSDNVHGKIFKAYESAINKHYIFLRQTDFGDYFVRRK